MLSESDYSQLVLRSMEELRVKTQGHLAWGIDQVERWDLTQTEGNLIFITEAGTKAVCPAQIIGSFDAESQTWLWAWANPSLHDGLKQDARRIRQFGEQNQLWPLTTAVCEADEQFAWYMTALAVKLCDSQGAYRGPNAGGTSFAFITFSDVLLLEKSQAIPPREEWPRFKQR
jgi:hypothetical protein